MSASSTSKSAEVVGDWKDFEIRLTSVADFDEISVHLRSTFYKDEPLNKLLDWSEDKAGDHDLMMRAVLAHGISLVAHHKSTQQIAGVRVNLDSRQHLDLFSLNVQSSQTLKILKVMKKLETESRVLSTFGVEFYADFFMSSVDPAYRGQGLATELYQRSLTLLKSKGFPLVKSSFTSPITRKIGTKLGFQELARIYLFDETDEKGFSAFPKASPDQFVATMALRL